MNKTIIIAEIGENHIGDMKIARMLIEKASEARADYVKFQSYRPENFKRDDPEYEWFRKVYLSDDNHFMLMKYAERHKIKFLTSPFSVERARFICDELKLKEVKIASGMMLNYPVLDYLNNCVHTVFMSTGMANIDEIRKSLKHLDRVKKVYILHCVSQYPVKDKDANLLAIKQLKEEFPQYEVGYSDHTKGYIAAIAAVCLGAVVVEKHFTFDRKASQGTDHVLSVDPAGLQDIVSAIRKVEILLGDAAKKAPEAEKDIMNFTRNRFV